MMWAKPHTKRKMWTWEEEEEIKEDKYKDKHKQRRHTDDMHRIH